MALHLGSFKFVLSACFVCLQNYDIGKEVLYVFFLFFHKCFNFLLLDKRTTVFCYPVTYPIKKKKLLGEEEK